MGIKFKLRETLIALGNDIPKVNYNNEVPSIKGNEVGI
jgi:hypothetical protein